MEISPIHTPTFTERVILLNETQWWSREKLEDLQIKKIQYLIRYVSNNIPYYSKVLNRLNLGWEDFQNLSDIRKLPMITKAEIQKNYDEFIPKYIPKENLYHRSTGGSTGTPLTIYMDLDFLSLDKANTEHYMETAGLNIFDYKSIRLYGDKIPGEYLHREEYWYVENGRKLVMSCYHINRKTTPDYVNKINIFAPVYIHTRPSAILPLAKYMISLDLKIDVPIRYIFCDGEYLTNGQCKTIEKAFKSRVYNVYGHTEGCVIGHSCEKSRLLHFMPQVGLVELLDKNGLPVEGEGERGEMVVTGFNNKMFPLIRYRTVDIGIFTKQKCDCGRNYPLLKEVEGRIQDYVVDLFGNLVPLSPAVFNYNDLDWKGIQEFQVYQDKPGILVFKIQTENDLSEPKEITRDKFKTKLNEIFGKIFSIEVVFVEDLKRTEIGKFRYLDQRLDMLKYL